MLHSIFEKIKLIIKPPSAAISEESKPICDRKTLSLEIEICKFSYACFLLYTSLTENLPRHRVDVR